MGAGNIIGNIEVLVVDDDDAIRCLVSDALRREGFRVLEAENGRVGVEHVRAAARPFSLVLMDHNMPEMDGLAACRLIHRCSPQTPIVMMSTDSLSSQVGAAGARAFLPKPFILDELINCVTEHLHPTSE